MEPQSWNLTQVQDKNHKTFDDEVNKWRYIEQKKSEIVKQQQEAALLALQEEDDPEIEIEETEEEDMPKPPTMQNIQMKNSQSIVQRNLPGLPFFGGVD